MILSKQRRQDWKAIKSLELAPGVDSLETFETLVKDGIKRARDFLQQEHQSGRTIDPTPKFVLGLHGMVFGDVYMWAGDQFRGPGLAQGNALDGGVPGQEHIAHWQRIEDGLLAIRNESNSISNQSSPEQKAEGIALYLHGFTRVCPFPIGNDCIGSLMADALSLRDFGRMISNNLDQEVLLDNIARFDHFSELRTHPDPVAPLRDQIKAAAGAEDKTRLKDIDQQIVDANKGHGPEQGGGSGAPATPASQQPSLSQSNDSDHSHEQ